MKPFKFTAIVAGFSSLRRMVLRLASNWRKAVAAHKQLRAEYWRDGELSLWMTSYVCAPVAWGVCGAFALYYTIKDESESQNEPS